MVEFQKNNHQPPSAKLFTAMSSILNAIRSSSTSTRGFTSLNIASATSSKNAFHPEHHPIVLQQLVQSLEQPGAAAATSASVSSSSASRAAANRVYRSASSDSASQIFAKQFIQDLKA
ncbi:hypothetical protein BGZ83_009232 [Gryganskiella cystojenkinii]|nr:hypothetical protein BGZ83_009232 [Gryganskiella cystojenkinii]